jgi:hypothetical protein
MAFEDVVGSGRDIKAEGRPRLSLAAQEGKSRRRSSLRRLSRNFLDVCQVDSDDDFFSLASEDFESFAGSPSRLLEYCYASSDPGSDAGDDLENMFHFGNLGDEGDVSKRCSVLIWRKLLKH